MAVWWIQQSTVRWKDFWKTSLGWKSDKWWKWRALEWWKGKWKMSWVGRINTVQDGVDGMNWEVSCVFVLSVCLSVTLYAYCHLSLWRINGYNNYVHFTSFLTSVHCLSQSSCNCNLITIRTHPKVFKVNGLSPVRKVGDWCPDPLAVTPIAASITLARRSIQK